jgi:hypothetical protein
MMVIMRIMAIIEMVQEKKKTCQDVGKEPEQE